MWGYLNVMSQYCLKIASKRKHGLHCTALYCTQLNHTALHCSAWKCRGHNNKKIASPSYITLNCWTAISFTVLHFISIHHFTLNYSRLQSCQQAAQVFHTGSLQHRGQFCTTHCTLHTEYCLLHSEHCTLSLV